MADQATMTDLSAPLTNGANATRPRSGGPSPGSERLSTASAVDSSTSGVVNNVAGFGENLLTLAELQTRLTVIELRQNLGYVQSAGALIRGGFDPGHIRRAGVDGGHCRAHGLGTGDETRACAVDRGHDGHRDRRPLHRGCASLAAEEALGLSLGRRRVRSQHELAAHDSPAQRTLAHASLKATGAKYGRGSSEYLRRDDDILDDLSHRPVGQDRSDIGPSNNA